MSNIEIIVQMTPNPNALKFVINKDVIDSGKVGYSMLEQCDNPLAALIMATEGVKHILFFENVITVTKHPHVDWDDIEDRIRGIIVLQMPEHNSNMEEKKVEEKKEIPTFENVKRERLDFDIQIIVQMTPNPNALKFVTNADVISSGKASYEELDQCNNPLSALIMELDGVKQILFFENIITVTKEAHIDWNELEVKIQDIIKQQLPEHNPDIKKLVIKSDDKKVAPSVMNSKYVELNAIFDAVVRPGLQRDGGDIEITDIQGDVVKVNYQGACHSCPSASIGTLQYIQSVVNEYNPELRVELDDEEDDFW